MVAKRNDRDGRRGRTVQDIADQAGSLRTGVEGTNVPNDFFIPGVGLRDVDKALFDLFDKRLQLKVHDKQNFQKVSTIFAGGERFALRKKDRPPVDVNGTLILPIVSIRRTSIEQSEEGTIRGRGIGQDTGDLVIRRRLSNRDPEFQSLINKLDIKNQDNIAHENNEINNTDPRGSLPSRIATRRYQRHSIGATGNILSPNLGRNIYEIITAPFPHFYTAEFEAVIWTQYIKHMNQIIEQIMTSYDAQGNQFRIDTDKGYWFVAYFDDNFGADDNFSDYNENERFVKYKFGIKVPAYLFANERKGMQRPFRRFLSAPQISFELNTGVPDYDNSGKAPVGSGNSSDFLLSDIQELDRRGIPVEEDREAVRRVRHVVKDPFSGKEEITYLRVIGRNQRKGETILSKRLINKVGDVNF